MRLTRRSLPAVLLLVLVAGGARLYPPAAYKAAFGVCLALAAGAVAASLLVTETRCRNVWQPAER